MKVLIVGRKFGEVAGGVERMALYLANSLEALGHHVALLTWDNREAQTFYSLNPPVKWFKLDIGNPLKKADWNTRYKRQLVIRNILKTYAPNAIICFQHGPFLAISTAALGLRIPIIAAERNAPDRFDHLSKGRFRQVIFLSFMLARKVCVQLESYIKKYPSYLRSRIHVIPNPVFESAVFADVGSQIGKSKTLLFVGRLSYQKNPEALIRAFSLIKEEFPDWELRLIGDGELRKDLEELVQHLGAEKRITFVGNLPEVRQEYQAANLFCLPSRFEGFPNALGEAMACGLPSVGYSGCAGINELILPGKNGLLASGNGDVNSLALALRELMLNPDTRVRMGVKAREIASQYSPTEIINLWDRLIHTIASPAAHQ